MKDQQVRKSYRIMGALAGCLVLSAANAATITQGFSADPQSDGWKVFGDTNLFRWDSTNQNLAVTWDSTRTNSFFYHRLGTILTRADDFDLQFDLVLKDIASGTEPGKTGGLEISIGLLNLATATSPAFMRGAYGGASDLAEFDYFPAGYYNFGGMIYDVAATTTPTIISTNSSHFAPTIYAPYIFELPTNVTVRVRMTYTAASQTLATLLTTNGSPLAQLPSVVLTNSSTSAFTDADDLRLDALSISSYSSVGDDYDSVLAHGTLDNLSLVFPAAVESFHGARLVGAWQGEFVSRTNWLYALERSVDFQNWTSVSSEFPGTGTNLVLQDLNPPADRAYYRVRAVRP